MLRQSVGHLNPVVHREGSSGALIELDIPNEHAASDEEASAYTLQVLNETLAPDDGAEVIDVFGASSPDQSTATHGDAGRHQQEPIDVEEVPVEPERDR